VHFDGTADAGRHTAHKLASKDDDVTVKSSKPAGITGYRVLLDGLVASRQIVRNPMPGFWIGRIEYLPNITDREISNSAIALRPPKSGGKI